MCTEHDSDLIDLGDAVAETKGTSPVGLADQIAGFRPLAGFSTED